MSRIKAGPEILRRGELILVQLDVANGQPSAGSCGYMDSFREDIQHVIREIAGFSSGTKFIVRN